jgi:hypothetical protein
MFQPGTISWDDNDYASHVELKQRIEMNDKDEELIHARIKEQIEEARGLRDIKCLIVFVTGDKFRDDGLRLSYENVDKIEKYIEKTYDVLCRHHVNKTVINIECIWTKEAQTLARIKHRLVAEGNISFTRYAPYRILIKLITKYDTESKYPNIISFDLDNINNPHQLVMNYRSAFGIEVNYSEKHYKEYTFTFTF